MVSRQEQRSEETKKNILLAASRLFSTRGYEAVTMRDIAKEVKCSHTTIYIYFKDKEALLYELSMPVLDSLKHDIELILKREDMSPELRLKLISQSVITFCHSHRNMYDIIFGLKSGRVDEPNPELDINKLRNALFGLLKQALQECLDIRSNDQRLLAYSRIYYFTLQGIVATYRFSEEPLNNILERVGATFDEAIEVLLIGFQYKLSRGMEDDAN